MFPFSGWNTTDTNIVERVDVNLFDSCRIRVLENTPIITEFDGSRIWKSSWFEGIPAKSRARLWKGMFEKIFDFTDYCDKHVFLQKRNNLKKTVLKEKNI